VVVLSASRTVERCAARLQSPQHQSELPVNVRTHRQRAARYCENRVESARSQLVCTSNMCERRFWLAPQNIRR
jgi:hypothetical protein